MERFDLAAKETQRLYYISIPNWTLELAKVSAPFANFFPVSNEAQPAGR